MIVPPHDRAANATTVRRPRLLHGRVHDFDPSVQRGAIVSDDGTTYRFHGAEIADGTRSISQGALVQFEPLPRLGELEAGRVAKVGESPQPPAVPSR